MESVEGFYPEKKAFPNANSLRGYGFIDIIRTRLKVAYLPIVSCADIIVLSARDIVSMTDGPFFTLPMENRDGRISIAIITETDFSSLEKVALEIVVSESYSKGPRVP